MKKKAMGIVEPWIMPHITDSRVQKMSSHATPQQFRPRDPLRAEAEER